MSKTIKIIIIVCLIGLMAVPSLAFSPKTASNNAKEFFHILDNINSNENNINNIQTQITEARQSIRQERQKTNNGIPSLNNAQELFSTIKNLPGVKNASAEVINFNGNVANVICPLNQIKPGMVIPGIQITVDVNNIDQFVDELSRLNTPYMTVNMTIPNKQFIIRYNTQGGAK